MIKTVKMIVIKNKNFCYLNRNIKMARDNLETFEQLVNRLSSKVDVNYNKRVVKNIQEIIANDVKCYILNTAERKLTIMVGWFHLINYQDEIILYITEYFKYLFVDEKEILQYIAIYQDIINNLSCKDDVNIKNETTLLMRNIIIDAIIIDKLDLNVLYNKIKTNDPNINEHRIDIVIKKKCLRELGNLHEYSNTGYGKLKASSLSEKINNYLDKE